MSKILSFIVYLIFLGNISLIAQQGGSNYSIFGIGDIRQSLGAYYDGLGGTQYAVPSFHAVNIANPAMWSESKWTRLQIGFRFTQTAIEQQDLTASQNFGKIDGITATFQVDTAMGITISGGIYPFSVVQYSVLTPVQSGVSGLTDLSGGALNYGKGGVSAAFIGSSWKPMQGLSIGIAALRLFGNISRVIQTELYTQPFISVNQRTDRFFGSGFKLGIAANPTKGLTLGLGASIYSDLDYDSDYRQSTLNTGGVAYDTVFKQTGMTSLPMQLGFGMSYISGRWMIASDIEMQDLSSFSYSQGKSQFRSGQRVSIGLSRLRSYQLGTDYIDKVQFNIGAGWNQLYYALSDIGIDEYYGSFGMQLPIAGTAIIDLAVQGGMRGNADLVRELFLRCGFSVSAGEVWFKPFIRE
jgi:hypothetical protein